jgi:hypothetical protein
MMPYKPNKMKKIMAATVETSNPLPGLEDQKCFLSLTIYTLN